MNRNPYHVVRPSDGAPLRLVPPRGEHRLDVRLAEHVPTEPGIYAAWIIDHAALAEIGIDGPPPILIYVGKATGSGGLRARLRRHAACPWWELIDLLASRRRALPGWWSHSQKNTARRTLTIPPLAMASHTEALHWQHRNLRWGWTTDPSVDHRALESGVIAAHRHLLNRHGQGYKSQAPMQLQKIGRYERERAWWLFHASWLAVLTLRPAGWIEDCWSPGARWRADLVAHDQDGWPVPLTEGTTQEIRTPLESSIRQTLADAAPLELRAMAADCGTSADQATAWWAAYAGHPFLKDSQPHQEALRAALARSDEAYHGPGALPRGPQLSALLSLISRLPRVTH